MPHSLSGRRAVGLTILLWLAAGVLFAALFHLAGCNVLPKPVGSAPGGALTPTEYAKAATQLRQTSLLTIAGIVVAVGGAAMVAGKYWMPTLPLGLGVALLGVGTYLILLPALLASAWFVMLTGVILLATLVVAVGLAIWDNRRLIQGVKA